MKQQGPSTESTLKVIKGGDDPDDRTMEKEKEPVGYFRMFRFADKRDKILMLCGTIAAIAVGISMPAFSLLWGNMTDSFQDSGSDPDAMVRTSKGIMFNFLEIGAGVFVACWVMTACWTIAGERQAIRCRKAYLDALLKQQIGWFDRIDQTQLSSKFSTQTYSFHGAIGEKVGTFVKVISTLVAGFVIAYIKGWKMALVVTAGIPAIGLSGFIYVAIIQSKDKRTSANYSEAGGQAQEVIGSIKTVKSLNGEDYEAANFEFKLGKTVAKSFKYAIYAGLGMGSVAFCMLSCYALGFWYGSKLVHDKVYNMGSPYTGGDVLVIFFSIVMGGFQLSQMGPCLKKFAEGQSAAAHIYAVLDRTPKIIRDPNGKRVDNLQGVIKFQNVVFAYPKQPERKILQGISFEITPNQTTAFVGESGCGKSTVMQLLMRFYDPLEGRITLDGIDLRELDLQWLRENIGYVGQEPVLFATTIKENLLFGNPKATDQQIIDALKKAEAYDFVMDLQKKLQTYVGYGGGQLSGGQKQRIAIARAILKNPRILLLDQATSALDRKNEKLIQNTLNKISTGRTTISIAHRTKTIMTAQYIIVVQQGQVKERGSFRDLQRFKDYEGEEENNLEEEEQQKEDPEKKEDPESKEVRKRKGSMSKEEAEKMEKQNEKKELIKKYGDSVFKRMIGYTMPDIHLFIVGVIGAIGNGIVFPIFSIYLARMIGVLIDMQLGVGDQSEANKMALIFFGLAIANFFAIFMQNTMFAIIADRLTEKIRVQVFNKMIRMPGGWFDNPKNNAGTLAARLSIDCKTINGVTSSYIGIMVQNVSCLTCGLIIAFVHEWRITLVTLGLIPIMIASGIIKMKALVGFSQKSGEAYKDSSNLIMEAMINIRTVTSFGVQNTIANKYSDLLVTPYKLAVKTGVLSGFLYGASQLVMFVIFALIFYIGTLFTRQYNLDFVRVFTAIYALIFSSMTAGRNTEMMPDLAECKTSGAYLFTILDGEDQDQLQVKDKSQMITQGGTNGEFQIKNITFKYPTRRYNTFENLNLSVHSGNKVALVGPSGCGKSTIIQMLLRFYDPDQGEILLDGVNLKNYDIHYLRSLFGLVSQEPALFNASYAENIKYNKADATIDDIRMAATKANALSFIESSDNNEGFNRGVGVKGSQISGGQKQRVAIARAILRNPKILLLDQATSALDSTNQKLVQDSLDNIMVNKTSVTVAHRIETIKNSDCIYVFSGGAIVESGNYKELVEKRGHFYDLEQGNYK